MSTKNVNLLIASTPDTAGAIKRSIEKFRSDVVIHRIDRITELHHAVDSREWHLIISDLELSDFSTTELTNLLRDKNLGIPVILIASVDAKEIAVGHLESGVDQIIARDDLHMKILPAMMDTLLRRAEKEKVRRQVEDELSESRERYLDIFENTSDLIQCLAPDGSFLYTNATWRKTMGYTEQEVRSLNLLDVLHPDSMSCCQDRFVRLKRGEALANIEFRFLTKFGETVHLSGDCGSIIKNGEAISTRGIFRDITETIKAKDALRTSEARYQALYENAPDIYSTISATGEFLSINQIGASLLGYKPSELIRESAAKVIHPEDQQAVFAYIEKQFRNFTPDPGIEYRKVRKDGTVLWVHQRVTLDPLMGEPRLLVVCRDITEKRKLEEQLVHQATHDALTNLINRREFELRLQRMLVSASDSLDHHVLCYLDLDQFKVINDTCGHNAGDELLRQIASLLEGQLRSRDTLARLGGDEFAVIMEHCRIEKAKELANKMRETIEGFRFCWRSRKFSVGVSIGVVPIRKEYTIEDVLSLADSACYAAKEQGRNRIYICSEGDHTIADQVDSMQWVASINEALETDRFSLYAQPIQACCAADNGDRYEILLRLQDGAETIRPAAFLPAAERFNLSMKIDHWVLDHVIEWFETHAGALERLDLCSINLSALSLCDDAFLQHALACLRSSAIPPHKLCFEITETAAISNFAQAMNFIMEMKRIGCHFALDDFGSGLSSFAYLKDLPVDMVKIDGTFIRNIANNEIDLAMVKSICDIVGKMGKQTTAEYVENAETIDLLRTIGVDFVQGYQLGRPVPLEQFSRERDSQSNRVVSIFR
jgi:diguanylate cyclase (GGDEF)-like protein/PAS domain S-box-containing protein